MNKQKLRFLLVVLFILSLNLVTGLAQVKASTQIEEIKSTKDAKVTVYNPDINYGANITVRLWHNPREDGFLFFDLNSIMEKNYISAMLRIYICESTATTVQVFPVNQSWNENTITWNNVPDVNMSIMCSQYFPVKGGFSYINVTTIVSNWTSEIIPNFGFYLITTINGLSFYSKEDSDEERHPTLEITVSLQKSSQPNIAGFEVTIIIFGMIGVIFILLINKRYITRINIS
ncbi:MAG: DNRLRE domain-containing protein [Promethearchaeota archaeon]